MLEKLKYILLAYLFQPVIPLVAVAFLFVAGLIVLLSPTEVEIKADEVRLKQIDISNCEITKAINSNKRLYEVKCES